MTKIATRAVRAGIDCDAAFGAITPPIVLSANFSFEEFGKKRAYDYSRSGNPTRDQLADALAGLEGGVGGSHHVDRHVGGRAGSPRTGQTRGSRARPARLLWRQLAPVQRAGRQGVVRPGGRRLHRPQRGQRCLGAQACAGLDRDAFQSTAAHHEHPARRDCSEGCRRIRGRRQHFPLARASAPDRAWCGCRRSFDDQVHQRSQRCGRRSGDRGRSCRAGTAHMVGQRAWPCRRAVRLLPHASRPQDARCTHSRSSGEYGADRGDPWPTPGRVAPALSRLHRSSRPRYRARAARWLRLAHLLRTRWR